MSIKVLIADKHEIVREGLCSLVNKQPDMEIIGQADEGMKAIDLAFELKPNVIIMEISLPVLNGVDATKKIISDFPEIKVIALSMHTNLVLISDMIKAGASGYILKDCIFNDLPEAIRNVHNGGVHLSPVVIGIIVKKYLNWLSGSGGIPLESLTEREREILKMLGEGENTMQIAQKLQVSTMSIEQVRHKIMKKLDSKNLSDFAINSILGGLTSYEINGIE